MRSSAVPYCAIRRSSAACLSRVSSVCTLFASFHTFDEEGDQNGR